MYNAVDQGLYAVAHEANWEAATNMSPEATGKRIGAESALAAFRGSPQVIQNARLLLDSREDLTDLEFRQLDKILLLAAESPGTLPEKVSRRIATEAELERKLESFEYCAARRGGECLIPLAPADIESTLRTSVNLEGRRRVWEASKALGQELKSGLAEVRDLRNELARELGYSSYFHLQVADYGLTVAELMELMETVLRDAGPLYGKLHQFAAARLASRYDRDVPEQIPAHWLPDSRGRSWTGLTRAADLDAHFEKRSPEWLVRQAESFHASLGMTPLPEEFWERSDLYPAASGSKRRKELRPRTWHIDRGRDIRTLMNVVPSRRWFEISHEQLGRAHYHLATGSADIPHVLREGMSRAFLNAVGGLMGLAAGQEPYLREIGLLPEDTALDAGDLLLAEALENGIVRLVWAAGVVTQFEHDLYEEELPADQFNARWWELKGRHQRVSPPADRTVAGCDACAVNEIIENPARYHDHVLAMLIKYQLHDYIARRILNENPHFCNYYGNQEVGAWLMEIQRLGATRDWRVVLEEKTGEPLGTRALLDYFAPLDEYLSRVDE